MSSCFLTFNPSNPSIYDEICYTGASFITQFRQQVNTTDSIPFFNNFSNSVDIDAVWTLLTAALVFCLQTGFTFIQSSFIRPNLVQNVLFKNLIGTGICAIVFYIVGYSMAYGALNLNYKDENRFMGVENILIQDQTYKSWFFEFMYLAVSSTIVAGSISQRCSAASYFAFTIIFSAWIYPVIVYWCWSSNGWLSPYSQHPRPFGGLMDFAGSGVVHMVGGFSGIVGAMFLGNRPNRFLSDDFKKSKDKQQSCIFGDNFLYHVCGTLFLWFGWYGFTCGRTLGATDVMQIASKVAVTTTLCAATTGLSVATFARMVEGYWSLPRICDGILCGLVAICSSCNVIDCGYAILIGFLAAVWYYIGVFVLELCKIDDPMNSFIIHGIGGGLGLLVSGLFATDDTIRFGYSADIVPRLIEASKGHRFATQIVGILVISIWTILNCILVFGVMKFFGIFVANDADNESYNDETNFNIKTSIVEMHERDEDDQKDDEMQYMNQDKK